MKRYRESWEEGGWGFKKLQSQPENFQIRLYLSSTPVTAKHPGTSDPCHMLTLPDDDQASTRASLSITTTITTKNDNTILLYLVDKMMPRQAYAPTPHSYVPNTALSATINLDEVRTNETTSLLPP